MVQVLRCTETGEALGWPDVTTRHTGRMCGRSNAASADGTPVEFSRTCTTGYLRYHRMIDTRIGRLLVASLRQAITELLPTRLEFYEEWLRPSGMPDGRIGLAPVQAVLSSLRQDGAMYGPVVDRAGRLTAEWWLRGTLALRRRAATTGPA